MNCTEKLILFRDLKKGGAKDWRGLEDTSVPSWIERGGRVTRFAMAWTLLMACAQLMGCSACGVDDDATDGGTPNEVSVSAEGTEIRFHVDTGEFEVRDGTGTVVGTSLTDDALNCAPFALALRPDDDTGTQYHNVEDPDDDLLWLRSSPGTLVSQSPLTVSYDLTSDDGYQKVGLTVVVEEMSEGFIGMNIDYDIEERQVAMMTSCFSLVENEHVVGGGERFDGYDLLGRVIPLSFRVPGPYESGTNEAHVPVPFFATTRGLAVLNESEHVGAYDVGAEDAQAMQMRFHGTQMKLRIRAGAILDNVAAHARFMGLPPMVPQWVLAPQQWRNEHALTVDDDGTVISNGRDRFEDDGNKLRELDIPTTAMWIDAPWSTGYNTFDFNEIQFPEPAEMIAQAEDKGYRVIVWATENINSSDDSDQQFGMPEYGSIELFEEFSAEGYLVSTGSGDPLMLPWARGSGHFVDFSNPDAVDAYGDLMIPILEYGVRGFKLDYGEYMRADLLGEIVNDLPVFFDGDTTAVHQTRYARLYHEAFQKALTRVHGDDQYIITRSGGIYDQPNGVVIWPGDLDNNFARAGAPTPSGGRAVGGLPAAVSGALSLAMSGYPFYGSDIGGYRGGLSSTEVLMRWAQFGAVSPIMQLGGGGTGDATHNPWADDYDEGAVDIYRTYARLHMDLVPTWERLLVRATTDGYPTLIPLGVFMGDDEEAWADLDSFLIGHDLLAAPIVESQTSRSVRFPEGEWIDWWTGDIYDGLQTVTMDAPLETMPFFFRKGAMVILGDPRLDTLVSAVDPEIVDPETYGPVTVIRLSNGGDQIVTMPDATTFTLNAAGSSSTLTAMSDEEREWVAEYFLSEDERSASSDLSILVSGESPEEVFSVGEFWDSAAPSYFLDGVRVWVKGRGTTFDLSIQ